MVWRITGTGMVNTVCGGAGVAVGRAVGATVGTAVGESVGAVVGVGLELSTESLGAGEAPTVV
jgi:hypothetical protein